MASKNSEYVIVKHADSNWSFYFYEDPRKGTSHLNSAFYSHTGKICGIDRIYTDKNKAMRDCEAMNNTNPVGSYGVCPVND